MKRIFYIIVAVIFVASAFTGCASAMYKKGVEYKEFPDKDVPIYDDAIVFSYKEKSDEWKIEYGTEDDVDDVIDFYKEEFEDEDYIIAKEEEDKDEYIVEGIIDEYEFEIEVEEASGDAEEYFDTVVTISVEEVDTRDKKDNKAATKEDDKDTIFTQNTQQNSDGIIIINETSEIVSGEQTIVGDVNKYQVEAIFESSAFEEGAKINISTASSEDFPTPDAMRFELDDTGYDISLEGVEYIRPDGVVEVTFKLTDDMISSLEDEGFLQIAYYFEGEWYLMEPESVDLEQGNVKLALYHFSWLFPAKLTKEEIRDQKAQEMAENKFNDSNNLSKISTDGKSDLEKVISQATGVTDTKALEAIAEYMLNEKDLTNLMLSADKGDYTSFSTKMAEVVASKINDAAKLGSNATLIAGAFSAAGYIWEGDGKGAAEAVANAILDSTAYGKLAKLAVKVTEETIKSWKANGIEEMYQAYKNGAEEGWFGYNVEKGEFEDALNQSSAIERQIRIDAVKSYCNLHGKTESQLTSSEIENIKEDAVERLKKKFEDRVAQEVEIAKDKEYYKNLLDAFEKDKVDWNVQMDTSLIKELTYEQRLESYTRVTDKILEMTGDRIIEFDGPSDDGEIPIGVVTIAIKKWYEEDGEQKVKEYLSEKGYIERPKAASLAGVWSGSVTYTEVYIDEQILESLLGGIPEESEDGCDQAAVESALANMTDLEGQSQDVVYNVTVSGTTVTMTPTSEEGRAMTLSYNEKTGTMTLISMDSGSDEDFTTTFNMSVSNTEPPTMHGISTTTLKEKTQDGITVPAGMIKITASIHLTKGS